EDAIIAVAAQENRLAVEEEAPALDLEFAQAEAGGGRVEFAQGHAGRVEVRGGGRPELRLGQLHGEGRLRRARGESARGPRHGGAPGVADFDRDGRLLVAVP